MMVLKGCPYSNPRSLCMCYSHGKANFADVIKVKDLETGKSKEGSTKLTTSMVWTALIFLHQVPKGWQ